MFFTKDLTVETTHTESSPLEGRIKVPTGVISQIGVFARPGCAGTARVQFFIGGHQIYPMTYGTYIIPTEYPLRFLDELKIRKSENVIVIKAWSVNAVYSHRIIVEINILRNIENLSRRIDMLKKAIGNQTYAMLQQMRKGLKK